MYFKRLELVGFKSFFDKTTLHFEPGITAVVGPNGCGKSNIFDSIRWVLGEQSAKSLRGSDMQDVIFNGTDNKDALGMAEVTLAFDNRSRFFGFDHDEVAITRRLFRSGESEYLLNKNTVRLKDISDLLLGTGVGAESYSIVAQGKIDLVLSSKPEERRMVFDEASGITKYKAQKRETARKLEETEQNLLRVNDIIAEVKRQIGSLERQANKARKYKEAFEELKIKEVNQAVLQKKELIQKKDEIINQLKEMEIKETELLDLIRKQEESISVRQAELRSLEDSMMEVKNQVLNLDNLIVRNNEHVSFNKQRLIELDSNRSFLENQIEEVRVKIVSDEENLNNVRQEYEGLRKNIEEKSQVLTQREAEINSLASAIKASLDTIADTKRQIMDLASKISGTKNQIADFTNKLHVFVARKKRLETEKVKVYEEKAVTQENLSNITKEVENIKSAVNQINEKISSLKNQLQQENAFLSGVNIDIDNLEKQRLSLESHKEFLLKLKTKYEDISESMNAVIYLDKPPQENMSGLVIKIKEYSSLNEEDSARLGISGLKISGEAKPIELDTQKIDDKIAKIREILEANKGQKKAKETQIEELNNALNLLLCELRNQELALANKESSCSTITEQFSKINQEEDIIVIELNDVNREVSVIESNMLSFEGVLTGLNNEQKKCEDSIQQEESNISLNSKLREDVLVVITQTKTELEGLNSRLVTDEETLKILEDTYRREKESLENIDKQIKDSIAKKSLMEQEISECEENVLRFNAQVLEQNNSLKDLDGKYREISLGSSDAVKQIEADRKSLDEIKNNLYELQMQDKDVDYKYATLKDRLIQAYKTDLDSCADLPADFDASALSGEINVLKQRLDSYGNVNLVAIEEYDELKQRYDFLVQQMNDLTTSKDALHQAILKINRTTKQMFVETFEKVKEEFRNYFRMLFNGGDAQLFLTDESDPLESGIEIICRPPGKKLQNVLLLSGGEKSMSAIALIFAIFKVKPSPFCILDEIDAALDEANVDRFSRMLQQFVKTSQFIVITHNKRTIANANVMYGITMEQSGVSKIVSVKFAENKENKEAQPQQPAVTQN